MSRILVMSAELSEQLTTSLSQSDSHELIHQSMAFDGVELPSVLSYSVSSATAFVRIEGLLVHNISANDVLFSKILGLPVPVAYSQIAKTIAELNNNPQIKNITLMINSAGGHVDGIDQAISALRTSAKPIHTQVETICASAGYWLASQTQSIEATSRLTRIGSIGVMVMLSMSSNDSKVKTEIIRSQHAPLKSLQPDEDGGIEQIQERINKIEAMFLQDVADGRDQKVEEIIANYGSGGMKFAGDALSARMIDSIQSLPEFLQEKNNPEGENTMSISKEEHEQLLAQATEMERNRVLQLQSIAEAFPCEASDKLVADAIRTGKSYAEVAPQAMEISKSLMAKLKEESGKNVEQPPQLQVPQPDSINTPQEGVLTAEERIVKEEGDALLALLNGDTAQ